MRGKQRITLAEAERIGNIFSIDWNQVLLKSFRMGLEAELDQCAIDLDSDETGEDYLVIGKIALEHLIEYPEYYLRLAIMEKEADEYWANV